MFYLSYLMREERANRHTLQKSGGRHLPDPSALDPEIIWKSKGTLIVPSSELDQKSASLLLPSDPLPAGEDGESKSEQASELRRPRESAAKDQQAPAKKAMKKKEKPRVALRCLEEYDIVKRAQ